MHFSGGSIPIDSSSLKTFQFPLFRKCFHHHLIQLLSSAECSCRRPSQKVQSTAMIPQSTIQFIIYGQPQKHSSDNEICHWCKLPADCPFCELSMDHKGKNNILTYITVFNCHFPNLPGFARATIISNETHFTGCPLSNQQCQSPKVLCHALKLINK